MATRYVNLTALGTGSGADAANADNIADINTQIVAAGAGGEVVLLTGTYSGSVMNSVIAITEGGTAGLPVTIRGQATSGTILRGNRTDPWIPGSTDGDPLFRLDPGADHLTFRDLHFERFGNGCFHVWSTTTLSNITIEDCTATNVMRFIEIVGTVNTFDVSGCTATGYSKGMGRLQGDTNDVRFTDCTGDSEHIDGDPYAIGFQVLGTVHDVTYTNCHVANHLSSASAYWNGDGFNAEEDNYDLTYIDCSSNGNADGGWDLKADDVLLQNCTADDNKRNFRFWGNNVVLEGCTGTDPILRGGTGTVAQLHVNQAGHVQATDCIFTGGGPEVIVYQTEAGSGTIVSTNGTVSMDPLATLRLQGAGSTISLYPEDGDPPDEEEEPPPAPGGGGGEVSTILTLATQTRDLLYGLGPTEHPQEDIASLADATTGSLTGLARAALWKLNDYAEFDDNGEVVIFTTDASGSTGTVRRRQFATTPQPHTGIVVRKNPLYPIYLIERMVRQVVRSMWPTVWTWYKGTLTFLAQDSTYELSQYIEDVVEVYQYDLNNDERYHQVHPDMWRVVRQVDTGLASTGNLLRLHSVLDKDSPVYYTAKRRPHPDDLTNLSYELADLVPWMAAAQMVYARGQAETYSPVHQSGARHSASNTVQARAQVWEGYYLRRLSERRDQLLLEVPKPRQWSPKRIRQSW